MPIIELQRRMRQLGEIRIGRVVDTGRISQRTNRPIMRPEKLDRFRLTSASRPLLEEVAKLYGGQVEPWTPANGGPAEWEVFTDAARLPILVPPRDPVTQWYEQYKGSKCVRRCDGVTEQKTDKPCLCDPDARDCQITTRLNVMLRDVPGLGVWLLTSHGFYAAVELPEVAQFLATTRGYVDAWLAMEEKQLPIVDQNGREGMARFMVPKLDVDLTPAQLLAGQGAISPAAVEASSARAALVDERRPAIEAPPAPAPPAKPSAEDFLIRARAAVKLADFKVVWDEAAKAGISPTKAQSDEMTAIGNQLKTAETPESKLAQDAKQQDAEDSDLIWQQIVAAWPGTTSELTTAFTQVMSGLTPESASPQHMQVFLAKLRAGELSEGTAA